MLGQLFNRQGQPKRDTLWHCGRVEGFTDSFCVFEEALVEQQRVDVCEPYGHIVTYEVIVVEGNNALLQAV